MPELPSDGEVGGRSLAEQLSRLSADLVAEHPELPPAQVEGLVDRVAAEFRTAKITEFVPILVRRQVDATLRTSVA